MNDKIRRKKIAIKEIGPNMKIKKEWGWNCKKQIKSIGHSKKKFKRVGIKFERWQT